MASPRKYRSSEGVTFIELLIVLGILLVVTALVAPVGMRMRTTAQGVKCVGNLRNIYGATLAFVNDYDGLLPPCQGPASAIHPEFKYNNYWWQQPYLARYTVGPPDRLKDSRGALRQDEVEIYNCPARRQDGPDERYQHSNGSPAVSYVMTRIVTANVTRSDFLFHRMENKSTRIFITEGRGSRVVPSTAVTGELDSGNTSRRIRRFHGPGVNVLFYDGHIELFTGPDETLQSMVR